ncbi:MAG: PDZ domain-containing protein [Alphaproteobacteria bacterium]|nr:PDZ domain-containing protein [Alphaproteobacteria bacterium]
MARAQDTLDARSIALAALIGAVAFGITALLLRPDPPAEAPHTVTLRLVDAEGQGVPCRATLWRVLDGGRRTIDVDSSQLCGPNGRLRWRDRDPGAWRVMAATPGFVMFDEVVTLPAGGVVDLGMVTLAPGGVVHGVITEDGEPLPGVQVRTSSGQRTVSAGGGAYDFKGVPVGPLKVRAARGHSGGGGTVDVVAGEVATLDIALTPVAPRGLLGIELVGGPQGVVIGRVVPGSPASGALEPGDLLVAVDGQPVSDDAAARRLLSGAPGAPVRLTVRRGGDTLELELVRVSDRAL